MLSVVGVVIKRGSFVFTTAMPMEIRLYGYLGFWGILLFAVLFVNGGDPCLSFSLRPSCVCGP